MYFIVICGKDNKNVAHNQHFFKKSCLETTYNYSAPQTLNMIERLSAEFILLCVAALTSSTTAGARHSSSELGSALTVAVVAVLQFSRSYSHTLKILIYLYINIELIFDFHTTYFGTATLQRCNSFLSTYSGKKKYCRKMKNFL